MNREDIKQDALQLINKLDVELSKKFQAVEEYWVTLIQKMIGFDKIYFSLKVENRQKAIQYGNTNYAQTNDSLSLAK